MADGTVHADAHFTGQTTLLCSFPQELMEAIAAQLTGDELAAFSGACRYSTFTLQRPLFLRYSVKGNYYPVTFGIHHRNNAIIRRALLYRLPDSLEVSIDGSVTALCLVSRLGHMPQVTYLIQRGANTNHPGEDGWSPLTHAVRGLESKAQRHVRPLPTLRLPTSDEHGRVILKLLYHSAEPVIHTPGKHLNGESTPRSLLNCTLHMLSCWQLSFSRPFRLVLRCLRDGAYLYNLDICGLGPLHHAVKLNDHAWLQLLWILLEYGANPNLEDVDGQTPLGWAIRLADPSNVHRRGTPHHQHVMRMLLDRGADPNRAEQGRHPLLSLAIHSTDSPSTSADIMRTLLRYGADPNMRDSEPSPSGNDENVVDDEDTKDDHSTFKPVSILSRAMLSTYYSEGLGAAKSDLATLQGIFQERISVLEWWDDSDQSMPLSLRMLPPREWHNEMVPVLLKGGATVSWADLEWVRTALISTVS